MSISTFLASALEKRHQLLTQAKASNTDCYRVFHGTVEGINGLNIDRYGEAWLIQSFHQALSDDELQEISDSLTQVEELPVIYNDRSDKNSRVMNKLDVINDDFANQAQVMHENGIKFTSKLRHEGQDPLLFLDMRVGREFVQANSHNKTVLNLFSYTCGIGTAAAVGGATRVMNIDFSSFALAAGKTNAELNQVSDVCEFIQSDAFPALRQLAGLKVAGRRNQKLPKYPKLPATQFDLVFLDPPRFAKSPFGIVDLINDYQSLFKPALLTTKAGGTIVCCNNVAKVDREAWFDALVRCVEKQGRTVSSHSWLDCHADFPSFDGNHPLKIVALTVD
ncbi:class I SAM-dependent methyltransferase [Shewanella eurypsychrophilus]|uniref:Class I SAM-dependent methyltransferase n=1 Tax=Shewanella eurypsychrophilus TaxID=2593656 RepID=A0ABX6VD52_9GAMM|nr:MULTISPECIES: class I SAM-dependent methyltransferase [Shewanella]QFU25449.1 class I SAM-dependent rRNA methyltransferase [Shewanella sp. YLB-09]QPG60592.1 class I SAM-dependent methyltransferase [Shewanella eurypsychrophilus]